MQDAAELGGEGCLETELRARLLRLRLKLPQPPRGAAGLAAHAAPAAGPPPPAVADPHKPAMASTATARPPSSQPTHVSGPPGASLSGHALCGGHRWSRPHRQACRPHAGRQCDGTVPGRGQLG